MIYKYIYLIFIFLLLLTTYYSIKYYNLKIIQKCINDNIQKIKSFKLNIINTNSYNNTIIITFFDSKVWREFYYYYYNSLLLNNITNYISFSFDKEGIIKCKEYNINCLYINNNKVNNLNQTIFHSNGFLERMFIRNDIIMNLLNQRLNIIVSDIDIIYIKNPIKKMIENNPDISLTIDYDNNVFNGGF